VAGVKQSAGAVIGQLAASPRTAAAAAKAKQALSQATRLAAFTARPSSRSGCSPACPWAAGNASRQTQGRAQQRKPSGNRALPCHMAAALSSLPL
jgi:hypothetical protein